MDSSKPFPRLANDSKRAHASEALQAEATRLLTLARKIEGVDINKADAKRKALEKINADVIEKRTLRSMSLVPH